MKQIFLLITLLFAFFLGASPWINPTLVEYDLLIVPRNILRKKSPLVRSISDMQVNFIRGEVMVMRNKEVSEMAVGDKVIQGDIIYVRENSWLVLEFGFGSKVKVNANSIVKINELRKNIDQFDKTKVNTFTLEGGSLYVDYPNISHNVTLRIKNHRAAMGIRGTEFIAAMNPDDQSLRVAVNHGKVELGEVSGKSSVMVGDMEGSTVDAKGNVEEVKSHKWVKNIHWDVEETALETPENYEQNYKNKVVELKKDHKAKLEDIQTFKPSGDAVTNANMDQSVAKAQEEAVAAANATPTPTAETVTKSSGDSKDMEKISEEDLQELDLNFTRYNKALPKINKNVMAKFAEKGMVPEKLQVAMETIKQAETYNKERLKALDEIDEEEAE